MRTQQFFPFHIHCLCLSIHDESCPAGTIEFCSDEIEVRSSYIYSRLIVRSQRHWDWWGIRASSRGSPKVLMKHPPTGKLYVPNAECNRDWALLLNHRWGALVRKYPHSSILDRPCPSSRSFSHKKGLPPMNLITYWNVGKYESSTAAHRPRLLKHEFRVLNSAPNHSTFDRDIKQKKNQPMHERLMFWIIWAFQIGPHFRLIRNMDDIDLQYSRRYLNAIFLESHIMQLSVDSTNFRGRTSFIFLFFIHLYKISLLLKVKLLTLASL